MPATDDSEISDEVIEEGSYYLALLGLSPQQIAGHFETTPERVSALIDSYGSKVKSGRVAPSEIDRVFWEDVKKEAEGDIKLTFLSEKGFHHAWKSELETLGGPALMSIYESSKDFLSADPNQKFLDFPPPKGYDPLALDRELRRAVQVIGDLLAAKWKAEQAPPRGSSAKP